MPAKNTKATPAEPKKKLSAKNTPAPKQPVKTPQQKQLDRLRIPGMTVPVIGYDGGIPLWLFRSGLTVLVDKNWYAKAGDVITVVTMPDLKHLASMQLKPGDEDANFFYFSIKQSDLPDAPYSLGYVVHLLNDPVPKVSLTLSVLVKTDLPGGPDNDQTEEGHSELTFTLSTKTVYPPDAVRGVTATINPYPNMHPMDVIYLQWGAQRIEQQVTAVGQVTVITISQSQLVAAGNSRTLPVYFIVVDGVGNPSSLPSKHQQVVVDLDSSQLDPPAILTEDVPGFIDLERLGGRDLELELYSTAANGQERDAYDLTVRAYPGLGGVVEHREIKHIVRAGTPVMFEVPHSIVRAGAGYEIVAGYVLRRLNGRPDLDSKKTYARVVGSIVRLEAPFFEKYPEHTINPIPDSAVLVIPWFEWRKPTDVFTVIMRYVKSLSETIIYTESREVGTSWPHGAPVKRLIYRDALARFEGYRPEVYFIYESAQMRARSVDLNESLRQEVQIGIPHP